MAQKAARNVANLAKNVSKLELNPAKLSPLPGRSARCVHLSPAEMSDDFFFQTFMRHGRRPQVAHAPSFTLYIKEIPKLAKWLRPPSIPLHAGPECLIGRHRSAGLFPQAQDRERAPPEVRVLIHRPKRLLGKLAVHRFGAGKRVFAAISWNVQRNNLWKGITIDTKQILFAIPTLHALEQPMGTMITDAETAMQQLGIRVGGSEPVAKPKETVQTRKKPRKGHETARAPERRQAISKREDASRKAKTQAKAVHTSTGKLDRKS